MSHAHPAIETNPNGIIYIEKTIETYGLVVELSISQNKNFEIIQNHWKVFNEALKKYKLSVRNGYWEKYGITFKTEDKYFYMAAVPHKDQVFPEHFIRKVIPQGQYHVFVHLGKMEKIKDTFYKIYKVILPQSGLKTEPHSQSGFIHFERYNHRFQWNRPSSIIDIFLPVKTNFR